MFTLFVCGMDDTPFRGSVNLFFLTGHEVPTTISNFFAVEILRAPR
jgi:hypothetical protein